MKFESKYVCDSVKEKREWLKQVIPENGCCIFQDLADLSSRVAYCERHQRHCKVHPTELLVCGFSCKSVSRQNCSRLQNKAKSLLAQGSKTLSTAVTWEATLGIVDNHSPDIAVLENVDGLMDDPDSSRDGDEAWGQADAGSEAHFVCVCCCSCCRRVLLARDLGFGGLSLCSRSHLGLKHQGRDGVLQRPRIRHQDVPV